MKIDLLAISNKRIEKLKNRLKMKGISDREKRYIQKALKREITFNDIYRDYIGMII